MRDIHSLVFLCYIFLRLCVSPPGEGKTAVDTASERDGSFLHGVKGSSSIISCSIDSYLDCGPYVATRKRAEFLSICADDSS